MVKVIAKLGSQDEVLEVPEGVRVGDLDKRLTTKWRGNVVVLVNGEVARQDQLLNELDRVRIFPLMGGG